MIIDLHLMTPDFPNTIHMENRLANTLFGNHQMDELLWISLVDLKGVLTSEIHLLVDLVQGLDFISRYVSPF